MTTNPLPEGYRRDRNGFPIGPCRRCGGSGRYSFNYMHLDMCYGCQGTGWQHAVPKHHAAWRDEVRKAVRVIAQDLEPGDTVRPWGARQADGTPEPARTVAAVYVTSERCAWTTAGDGTETTTGWTTEVTWADNVPEGTCQYADDECFGPVPNRRCHRHAEEGLDVQRIGGTTLFHREGVRIDPAPYVAKAERGLAYLLSRR